MKQDNYLSCIPDSENEKIRRMFAHFVKEFAKADKNNKENTKSIVSFIDRTINESGSQECSSCKKGCSFCCYLNVDLSEQEGEILLSKVTDEDWKILERQSKYKLDTWRVQKYSDQKCIFLKQGVCSVYEDRPLKCRNYFVTGNPKKCNTEKKIKKISIVAPTMSSMMIDAFYFTSKVDNMARTLLTLKNKNKV